MMRRGYDDLMRLLGPSNTLAWVQRGCVTAATLVFLAVLSTGF